MVVTLTLNPAIDYVVSSDRFEKGEIHRCSSCSYGPGGKGVNVSLLLTSLGVENIALGAAAGFSGIEIVRLLNRAGCKTDFLFLEEGHSRINLKVLSPGKENTTETDFNGEGPVMSPDILDRLGEKLAPLGREDVLVLAGSVPRSLPRDAYRRLLKYVEGKEILTAVDAAGETLLSVLPCRPFLIKPNLEELRELCQTEVKDLATAKGCARQLQKQGARNVVVSMGEQGALLVCEDGRCLFCRSAQGKAVSTVGAGDSLVAGFLYGLKLHGNMEEALTWGVAAGAATAFSQGIASGDAVKAIYPRVGNVYFC